MAQADYPPRDRLSLRAYIRARLRGRGLLEFADDDEEARRSADLVYVNCGRAWHEDAVARTPLELEALMATTTDMELQGIGNTVLDNAEFWSSTGSSTNTLGEALLYRFRQPCSRVAYVSVAVYRAFYQHGDPLYPPSKVSFLTGPTPNQLYPASPVYPVRLTDEQQFFALTPTAAVSRYLMVRFHGRRQRQWEDLQYYIAIRHVAAYGDPGDPSYDMQIARLARSGGVAWPCSRGLVSAVRWEAGDGAAGGEVDFWTPFRQLLRASGEVPTDPRVMREDVYLAGPVSSAESSGVYVTVALPRGALTASLPPPQQRPLGPQGKDVPAGRRGRVRRGLLCAVMPSGPTEAELRLAAQAGRLSRALPHLVQAAWPGVLLTRGAARRLQTRMEQKLRGQGQVRGPPPPPERAAAGGIGGVDHSAAGGAAALESPPPSAAAAAAAAAAAGASRGRRLMAGLYEAGVSEAHRGWMGEGDADDEYELYSSEYDEDEYDEGGSSDGDRGPDRAMAVASAAAAGAAPWAGGSLRRLQEWVVAAAAEGGDAAAGPASTRSGGDDMHDSMDVDTRNGAATTGSSSSGGGGGISGSSGSSGAALGHRAAVAAADSVPASARRTAPELGAAAGAAAATAAQEAGEDDRTSLGAVALLSPALALLSEYLRLRNDLLGRARVPAAAAADAGAGAAPTPSTPSAAAGSGQQQQQQQQQQQPPRTPADPVVPHLHRPEERRTASRHQEVADGDGDEWLRRRMQAARCGGGGGGAAAAGVMFASREGSVAVPALRHTPPQQRLPPPKLRRRGSAEAQARRGGGGGGGGDATAAAAAGAGASGGGAQPCWRHQRAALRAMQPAVYRPERSSLLFVALEAWAGGGAGAGGDAAAAVPASRCSDSGCWLVSHYDHEHM